MALSPRIAVSTVLKGATFVASFGKFQQAPDYQYLVDAAFDDTLRTGRSRTGNPDLGFENSTQYEFSVRVRPTAATSLRTNLYIRRLDGLVGSVPLGVDPDSSIFGNADAGSVKGFEIIAEREFKNNWGVRVSYNLMDASANSSNAFLTRRAGTRDPVTGIITPAAKVEFPLDYDRRHAVTAIATGTVPESFGPRLGGVNPIGGLEATTIVRLASGLPFSRYIGDSLVGVPNENRLPSTSTIDLLIRRPLKLGTFLGSLFLDVRNLINQRNIIAVRRDSGKVTVDAANLQQIADAAYAANPAPIPYESPRYRRFADADNNGYIEGSELQGLYLAAARDFTQPIFFYAPPRQFRLGVEMAF
jgi:outer membrane receptor protein involved in Fe transport